LHSEPSVNCQLGALDGHAEEARLHSPLYVLSADPELETVQARDVGRPNCEGYTIVNHAALGRHAEGLPRKRDMRFETGPGCSGYDTPAKDRGGGHADDDAAAYDRA
jgi:hypothetical protein